MYAEAVNWGTAIKFVKTSEQEGYKPDLSGGPDWAGQLAPQTRKELVGNERQFSLLSEWFACRLALDDCGLLILHGDCGVGKTSAVLVEALERGLRLVHMAADEVRTAVCIENAINSSVLQNTFLFLDDADALVEEPTGLSALVRHVKSAFATGKTSLKVVVCLDDITHPKLQPLVNIVGAMVLRLHRAPDPTAVKFVNQSAKRMGYTISYFDALLVGQQSQGDLRRMLIRLQLEAALSDRVRRLQSKKRSRVVVPKIITTHAYPSEGGAVDEAGNDQCMSKLSVWPYLLQPESECRTLEAMADALSLSDVLCAVPDAECTAACADDTARPEHMAAALCMLTLKLECSKAPSPAELLQLAKQHPLSCRKVLQATAYDKLLPGSSCRDHV